jgi:nucleoid DNA-binding protein
VSPVSTSEAITLLAEKLGVPRDEVRRFCQAQAELALKYSAQGYPIRGVGVLAVVEKSERTGHVFFGPDKGKIMVIKAKKILKFRVSKFAKDIVFGPPGDLPDVSMIEIHERPTIDD